MKLGWVDLGDGAGISASVEGGTLTLSGALEAGGVEPSLGQRAALASLRSGQILPLYSPVTDQWARPELDGVYRIDEAGFEHSVTVPWAVKLTKVSEAAGGRATISGLAQWRPWFDITYTDTYARMGVPGSIEFWDETQAWYDDTVVLDEGMIRTVTWNHYSAPPHRVAHVSIPEVHQWLAGSPRVQVLADGEWWTLHGQPPPGLPVRIHNGRIGVQLPAAGVGMELFSVSTAGVVGAGKAVTSTNLGATQPRSGVRITQATSEVMRVEWAQHFTDTATRNHQIVSMTIRRGADHIDYRSTPFALNLRIAGTKGAEIKDAGDKLTGAYAGDFAAYSGQEVTVTTPVAGFTDFSAAYWYVFGLSGYRGRAWVSPRLGVLRS